MMGGGYTTSPGSYPQGGRKPGDTGQAGDVLQETLRSEDEVDESYEEYVEDTNITDRQGEKISDRRDVLVGILDGDLAVEDSRLIGSFTRGTMTGPLKQDSDADVMVVLDADKHRDWINQENGPTNALRAIKRRIENDPRFSQTDVRIDQNAVKVKYHDSTIEIVPAFRYSEVPHADHPSSGFNLFNDASDGYAIPDTHGQQSWQGTNPRKYKQMFDARDEAHNGRVSGLTRAAKDWADQNNVSVRSYHMEIMVYNYFEEKARRGEPVPSSYSELTREFMQSVPSRVQSRAEEPVYGEAVDKGMSRSERRKTAEKAKQAGQKLEEAKRLKEQGKTEEAKEKLREVHGGKFN
ncbi:MULTISPECIES: CBASS oligonucleotide cyclase [unclassified Haloferax]|uniref:CBASS oligonucleotide cyclase n=1 Tax=unclassified Haloferax TaxID=2625095 RepID=UPI00287533F5|nr:MULTISPECIES: CBASS oligonucleotide cyclase [unclassified Haloferax]MDS0243605.1 nucleotidyltransferase [Haloferax sp. S2CR25]MDS0446726.1 nucleotidyltransferase [Haloferax sp. S2CR25-2]